MLTCKFPASLNLFIQTLCSTAHLSYVMQSKSSLITDIVDTIEETKEKITEIQTSEIDLPFKISEDAHKSCSVIIFDFRDQFLLLIFSGTVLIEFTMKVLVNFGNRSLYCGISFFA